ncbi:MAG: TetR/AcrR family transcriptional regulator [Planctomycetota bacterium]|nr:MAG: TetR/AcrR family transcriptional regulator [Planctomycetota bacterium]
MGIAERRERERQEAQGRILDAARELFVAHGYEAVSMRQIAERAEYSPAALYFHFEDKKALFRALCEQDFRALAQRFQGVAGIADPLQRLAEIGRAYADFALRHPNHYRLMFMAPKPMGASESLLERNNPDEDAYAFLLRAVKDAWSAGCFRPELNDPELIAQTLWASIHGVVSLHIVKREEDEWIDWRSPAEAVELMTAATLRGLARGRR